MLFFYRSFLPQAAFVLQNIMGNLNSFMPLLVLSLPVLLNVGAGVHPLESAFRTGTFCCCRRFHENVSRASHMAPPSILLATILKTRVGWGGRSAICSSPMLLMEFLDEDNLQLHSALLLCCTKSALGLHRWHSQQVERIFQKDFGI